MHRAQGFRYAGNFSLYYDEKQKEHSGQNGDKKIEAFINGVKVDVVLTNPKSYGAALFYLTGPSGANIGRRRMAKEQGLLLNREGVFDRKTGRYLAGRTEKDVYKALGKPYKKPEERIYG